MHFGWGNPVLHGVSDRMCSGWEVVDIVGAVPNRMAWYAGRFCEGYMPKSPLVSAPLENGRLCVGDCDVIVVVDHCASVTFMKNGDISIVGKGSNAEERVG